MSFGGKTSDFPGDRFASGQFPLAIFQNLSPQGSPQWEGEDERGQARAYACTLTCTLTHARAHPTHTLSLFPPLLLPPGGGSLSL